MQTPPTLTRELVLIGGGHTHALVLRKWGMNPLPGARLTLINPGPTAPYTGMLPGHVAGHYERDELDIDLVRLARFAGARLILGKATGLDPVARTIGVEGRPPLHYHVASIDIGITSDMPDLPGFTAHGVAAKPLDRFAREWDAYRRDAAARKRAPRLVVIGAGVAGVELAMAMAHALEKDRVAGAEITVIERGAALPNLGDGARAVLRKSVARLGIEILEDAEVSSISAGGVTLADGRMIPSSFTVGAAGARPYDWLGKTGLDLEGGFIKVDQTLRTSDPAVYAVGDCAHLTHAPRPKAGVFAVREAPVLFHNLRADLTGRHRQEYHPQNDYLKLVSLGGKSALADRSGWRISGPWLWTLKNRIDRDFMDRLKNLPPMVQDPPAERALGDNPEAKPLCGGCGSKVGGGALARVLGRIDSASRPDVLSRPGDDAAVLKVGAARQVLTTDHFRAFTNDPFLLAHITAIHAMGDIWAMGAEPQAALASVILPRMSADMQEHWLEEIMAAASAVFAAEGAEIVGGHTTMGAELTLGFTVTGLCRNDPITIAGARPGDVLILTKPIGTGTILAAEMALRAKGQWVTGVLDAMTVSQGQAARILSCANAMTDVTGFGLAGHAQAIANASGVCLRLRLSQVPVYPGALELAADGIRSTIWTDNRTLVGVPDLSDDPRATLLFDPQSAGGLLAAVPAKRADDVIARLQDTGYAAATIMGEVVDGPPGLQVE